MSSRRIKTLFLQGIAVGEYLGSDDAEEDLEAARQVLRDKGLDNSPTLLQTMRGQADNFAAVSNLAYKAMQERGLNNPPLTLIPFVVNAAFAAELYLKTLLTAAGVTAPTRMHKVVTLHGLLPAAERAELETLCTRNTHDYDPGTTETLAERLVPLNDAFVRWRYAYEHERVGMLRPRSLILVLKLFHERCRSVI